MKLVTYQENNSMKIGASVDGRIIHLNSFLPTSDQLPENMVNIMAMGDAALHLA